MEKSNPVLKFKNSNPNFFKKIFKVFTIIWVLTVTAAFAYYLDNHLDTFIENIKNISFLQFLLSALFLVIGKLFVCENSRQAIAYAQNHRIHFFPMYYLYTVTDIAKYVPGGVWALVSRVSAYAIIGINLKANLKSFIIENSWLIGWSILFGLSFSYQPLLNLNPPSDFIFYAQVQWVTDYLASIGPLWFSVFLFLIGSISIFIIDYIWATRKINIIQFFYILIINLIGCIFLGLSIACLLPNLSMDNYVFALGAFSLARASGYIAFFAPAGIGVREVIFTVVLTGFWPMSQLVTITAIYRILTMIVEFSVFGIVFYLGRDLRIKVTNKEKNSHSPTELPTS